MLFLFKLDKTTEIKMTIDVACSDVSVGSHTCREWFVKFKKSRYDLSGKIFGDRSQKFGRDNLQAILDDDLTRTTLE